MTRLCILHLKLTDAHSLEINARGWACPTGNAYMAAQFKGDYRMALELGMVNFAAIVEANDLEHAYRLTNHIDAPWTDNPEIRLAASRPRSTSVGDLIYDPALDAFYRVADFGFEMAEFPGDMHDQVKRMTMHFAPV